jgi:MscS family membrane protein
VQPPAEAAQEDDGMPRFLGFAFWDLVQAFLILLATLLLRGLITRILFRSLKRLARRTDFTFDDDFLSALEKPVSFFLLVLGVFLSAESLPLAAETENILWNLFRGLTAFTLFWALWRLVDVVGEVLAKVVKNRDAALYGFIPLLKKTLRIFVVVVGALMIVDNLGYEIAPIIGALGLGGAAIALAARDTIANLFGSLMIVLDRPFKVGDWIMVGDKVDGDVEEIGLRSTKVRTWPKTIISIPNSVLANEYINNWSRMPKRRVKQIIGVTYGSSAADMQALVEDFRTILREDEGVQQDFILVSFHDFGESSLDILVYYFTSSTAWLVHMDVRQRVNLKLMQAVEARGLSVAFPTRTLHFDGDLAHKWAGALRPRARPSEMEDGQRPGWNQGLPNFEDSQAHQQGRRGASRRRTHGGEQAEGFQLPDDHGPTTPL